MDESLEFPGGQTLGQGELYMCVSLVVGSDVGAEEGGLVEVLAYAWLYGCTSRFSIARISRTGKTSGIIAHRARLLRKGESRYPALHWSSRIQHVIFGFIYGLLSGFNCNFPESVGSAVEKSALEPEVAADMLECFQVVELGWHDVANRRTAIQVKRTDRCRVGVTETYRRDSADKRDAECPVVRTEFVERGIVHSCQEVGSNDRFAVLVSYGQCPCLLLTGGEMVAEGVPLQPQFLVGLRHLHRLAVSIELSILDIHYIYINTVTPVFRALQLALHLAVDSLLCRVDHPSTSHSIINHVCILMQRSECDVERFACLDLVFRHL